MHIIRFMALIGSVAAWSLAAAHLPKEPLGQSSRLTSLAISEIMYNPPERTDGRRLEYIELFNSAGTPEEIGGYRLDGSIRFVFPQGTVIPARGFLVVARVPQDVQSVYSLQGVLGPFEGDANLPNDRGVVQLRHRSGAIFLETEYSSEPPWPVEADGAGHSLVLSRPSFGENDPRAWAASHSVGGSPLAAEPAGADPADSVAINEFLAHTDEPELDYIELYNRSASSVALAGYVLTDDSKTNKFVFPANSAIPPGGFLVVRQDVLNFALSAAGETLYFKNPAGTRVLDAVRFGGQENGVSTGRIPDGGSEFYRQQNRTPGAANSAVRVADVVINELMYHPISKNDDDQFIELHNRGTTTVSLGGWQLEGGVAFTFPASTTIAPNGYLVVGRNVSQLLANHTNLSTANTLGGFQGSLSRSGERIALAKPDSNLSTNSAGVVMTNRFFVEVDEVTYGDGGRWGEWSDGGGSSLERIDARADSRQASNWADSDETTKARWTDFARTGRLDNGNVAADQLQALLQGAGECLIDDVQVFNASGANVIGNSTFEGGATGWVAEGTQGQSSLEMTGGFNSARSYHVRASDRGDNQINRIRTGLTTALSAGTTATIRAKVRWLKGHPELLLRLRGNWLDGAVIMDLPRNLGTPGARNSRALGNGGPAIFDVAHAPILPAGGQAATVTASVSDPDGIQSLSLFYRVDPSTTYTTVAMADSGTAGDALAGDGIYSAQIPGRPSGNMVACYVEARDGAGQVSRYPASAPAQEHLVRFGETTPTGDFPVYRIWMTQATQNRWTSRPKLDNTPLPVTFVHGNHRIIQNSTALYAGSPYISGGYTGPTGNRCGYSVAFPSDDAFLGDQNLVLDWPGGHGNERTAMQEQMGYWIADRMNLPYSHRYWIRLHVNGVTDMQRGTVFEAVQQPAGDFLDAWLPKAGEVDFYKIDRAFEFNDGGGLSADPQPRLENYTTVGGARKTEKYRWTFLKRGFDSANDYSNIFSLVDALNAAGPEPYTSHTERLIDLEEWIGVLAFEHIVVNFDAYGHIIGKNMYAAKPENGPWQLYLFDLDWLMLAAVNYSASYGPSTAPLFNADDPTMVRMYNHPPFRRAYFRAMKKAVDGPLRADICDPVMDAKYSALVANGITMCDGQSLIAPAPVKTWFAQRRAFLVSQLDAVVASFAITSNGGANFSTGSEVATLAGTAPIEVKGLRVNGEDHLATWTSITNWTLNVAVRPGLNVLNIQGYDADGALLTNHLDSISVTSTSTPESPAGRVVFNEIMHNPAIAGAEFVEVLNLSSNRTFDLSGWQVNGLSFEYPNGTLLRPGATAVAAKDSGAFTRAYGNNIPLAGVFDGNLDQDGETLSLLGKDGALIDVVSFGSTAPWPATAAGASLQLIDAAQDNFRVANWGVAQSGGGGSSAPEWRFVSTTGTASSSRLYIYMTSAGEVYIDDLKLVAGTTPETGANLIANGDFEGAFPGPWNVSANLSGSAASSAFKHSGGQGLGVVSSAAGTTQSSSIWQDLTPLTTDAAYTLSYWYLTSTNGDSLTMRLSGSGINHTQNIAPGSATSSQATPGAANSIRRSLPAFPQVWINELLPNPTQGAPWAEFYNSGDTAISLAGWHLTDNFSNLSRWAFPQGATIGPKQFLLVWLDGAAEQSTAAVPRASFRIPTANGSLALVFPFGGQPTVLDYLNYTTPGADRSLGFYPDGQAGPRQSFFNATPGAANNNAAQPLPVFINEWMAANTSTIADPADGDFDDWFEIYNPNDVMIDLTGYFLADSITDAGARWRVPSGTIVPARGLLLVWADSETGQNTAGNGQLHANFRLSQSGESIALFAPNGTLVDSVTFGAQANNISEGRLPDGTAAIDQLPAPSPGTLNGHSTDIMVRATLSSVSLSISWNAQPGLRYRILQSAALQNDWTTLVETTAIGSLATHTLPAPENARQFFKIERIP